MIIPEPSAKAPLMKPSSSPVRSSHVNDSDHPQPPQLDSPPSYGTYEARQSPPIQPYPAVIAHQPHYHHIHQIERMETNRRSASGRFWRAFAVAIFIWVLVSAFVRSVIIVVHPVSLLNMTEWPIPSDVDLVNCYSGSNWTDNNEGSAYAGSSGMQVFTTLPRHKDVSFDLLVDSEELFVLSRGAMSGGALKITTSDEQRDTARVDVRVEYTSESVLDYVKVCQLQRGENGAGVGIFTPTRRYYPIPKRQLRFFVNVDLPASSSPNGLHIKKLQTDMPNFLQRLGDLAQGVFFDTISLRSSNGLITVQSLIAGTAQIETSNGGIDGNVATTGAMVVETRNGEIKGAYNATGSLNLVSTNGIIKSRVYINTGDDESATLDLRTSNGYIQSDISLLHTATTGGDFNVVASSSNSPLRLHFLDAPLNSKLALTARTSNSPAQVTLHPTYEGGFQVSTSNMRPNAFARSGIEDPSGRGRQRDVQISRSWSQVTGSVSWSDEGRSRGRVVLSTSNSPASLEF
ncbi:hypothetical protein AMATHDRAFT_67678 [Amanita thiersii Skay4041]|uniref:Uncharacterized protein n=1 Tax=Amanita thiersii Skay4041 TaxID=703135 RepID=A0A2A9NDU6_9AGAR|nr:hypothetical protein AMATHDRAFT_67678 [Amanita thiersii Skay4041]